MKESLLYAIQAPESSRTHYILGTMHVSSEEAYTPVSAAKHYMEMCKIYIGEMDLNDPDLDHIGTYFMNPDSLDLEDMIGSKKYKKYRKVIKKSFQVELDNIAHYRPMVIANMISESILTKKYDLALDHFLWEYAQAMEMDMRGLESAQDQFEIMEAIPMDVQLKSLKSCVKNVSVFRKKVTKTTELYGKGKLTKLYKVSKKSMGVLRKLMIYDRNKKMTKRLVKMLDEGATFTAVGAAHLAGSKGMLRLLKKAGYKVRPLDL